MLSAEPTPYDLRFQCLGIPARVHPAFWVIGLLLGWQDHRLDLTVLWLVCLFVSIFVHEMGHALVARQYGWRPHILLYHFGGLAFFQPGWNDSRGRQMWIAFAGPLAGFFLGAIVYGGMWVLTWSAARGDAWALSVVRNDSLLEMVRWTIACMLWINIGWGLVNLLPVFPLDGGKICYELLNARGSYKGLRWTHTIGGVTAAAICVLAVTRGEMWIGLLFGGMAWQNWEALQRTNRGYY